MPLSSSDLSLEELEKINFYTKYSDALYQYGVEPAGFDDPVDEVQYIASLLLTESIKFVFHANYHYIAVWMGPDMEYNDSLLNLQDSGNGSNVYSIINKHRNYLNDIMPEYVSQMIQSTYQDASRLNALPRKERHQLNSWDMYGILKNISQEKESTEYQDLMNDFYNLAVDHATTSGASKLSDYKRSNPEQWVRDLYSSVLQDDKVEARMDSMNIENSSYVDNQNNTLSLASAAKILNSQNSNGLSDDCFKRFEDTIYTTFILSASLSTKWGQKGDEYSAVNNTDTINETLELLRSSSNDDIQLFLNDFFAVNNKDDFINFLTSMNADQSIYSQESVDRITVAYPEFDDNNYQDYGVADKLQTRESFKSASVVGSDPIIAFAQSRITKMIMRQGKRTNAPSAILNMFLFIVGTSHYSWAIAGSDEKQMGFADNLGIGVAMFETTASLGYYAAVKAISKFMTKNAPSQIAKGTMYFKNYANFWLGVSNTNKVISRLTTRIADAIFSQSALAKFITKASFALSLVSLGFGITAMVEAGYSGNTVDIVFEALNVVVSTVGVIAGYGALIGAAFAGPVGLAVLGVTALLMIARWVYDATKPEYEDTRIEEFTNQVVKKHGYMFDEIGKFLTVVQDTRGFYYLKNTSLQTLELDSENNESYELDERMEYPRAVSISMNPDRYGVVYSFDGYINPDNHRACYEDYNAVCENGFKNKMDWTPSSEVRAVIAAVESTSLFGATKSRALFWCKLDYNKSAVYMTDGLDESPRHQLEGFEEGDNDIQDIAAINDQNETVLLIATKKNLYRATNNWRVQKINSTPLTEEENIHSVELYAAGDIAHLIIRFTPLHGGTSSQAQLFTVSSSGVEYDTIRESAVFELDIDDRLICRKAFYDGTVCNDFVAIGPRSYRRMKATLDENESRIIGFGSGLDLASISPMNQAVLLKNTYLHMAI
ncbi:hypothetical protein AND4_06789 [Vibrio sp. AND4]|nr:hypothetical protein AND4_06789 [Vibrio sp. AND4]